MSVIIIFIRVSFSHTGGLGASIILGSLDPNKYLGKLISFLDPVLPGTSRTDFVRCWHAKTDGWAASTFHSNCDGRGPTVTIIKVNDSIFGGYTDVSWSSTYILAVKFFLVQGLKDLEGKELTLEGLDLARCLKQKKEMSPKACFLKFLATLRARSHI